MEHGRTLTTVRRLDEDGRVDELSRMLGGANITPQLKASALEILRERQGLSRDGATAKGEATPKGESESRMEAKAKPQKPPSRRTGN